MVGGGASNAQIATSLFMSEATVQAHVSRLLSKLQVDNRVLVALLAHDADDARSARGAARTRAASVSGC